MLPNSNKLRQRNGSALTTAWRSIRNCLHLCKHSFSKQSLQMLRVFESLQSQQFKYWIFSLGILDHIGIFGINLAAGLYMFILVSHGVTCLLPVRFPDSRHCCLRRRKKSVESLEMEKVRLQNPSLQTVLKSWIVDDIWIILNIHIYIIYIYNIYIYCIYLYIYIYIWKYWMIVACLSLFFRTRIQRLGWIRRRTRVALISRRLLEVTHLAEPTDRRS